MPQDDELAFRENPRNVQYTTKVARLLNQTEAGVARAVADESENFLERQYGRLFIALDVNFTSDTYDVSEVLVDTIEREYFADLNRSVEQSFEQALTVANQTLADLAAEGQNDWVGQLNAVVCVLHENTVYVTQVGTAQAYLARGHALTQITEGLSVKPHEATAKTFLNIANGQLDVGDKLLLSTKELFNHLSVNDLKRTLYLHAPNRAVSKFAEHVQAKGTPGRLATVVVELTTIDLVSAEAVNDDPDEIILGAPRRHFEALQRFKPFRKDTPLADLIDRAKKYWDKRLRPELAYLVAQVKYRVASWNAKRKGEASPPPPVRAERVKRPGLVRPDHPGGPRHAAGTPETAPPQPIPDHTTTASGSRAAKLEETAKQVLYGIAKTAGRTLAPAGRSAAKAWRRSGIPETKVWQQLASSTRPITARLLSLPIRQQLSGSRRILYRNLVLLACFVLLISLFMAINASQTRKAETKVRERIKSAEALQAKAEASYIFKDLGAARTQLAEAKVQADELRKEKVLKPETAKLEQSITASYDRINNVVLVANQPVADFRGVTQNGSPTHLTQSGTTLFAMGDSGAIYAASLGNKEVKVASANPGLQGKILSATTTSNGDVLLLTNKPSVYQYDTATGNVSEIPLSVGSSWEAGNAIDAVQQNAFILDPEKNQIWRHTRTLSVFNKGEAYLSGSADLKDATDLVSGAQVFVLKPDGKVLKFAGGNQQQFVVAGPPAPDTTVTGANALSVNFTTNNLYAADPKGKRIIEYSEKGDYLRQFKNDGFVGLSDFTVDDKTNTMFVLAGSKLWQINLAG